MIYKFRIRTRDKWSGVQGYENTSKVFGPAISKKTRALNLGALTSREEVEDTEGILGKKGAKVEEGKMLRKKYEKLLNLDDNALTPIVRNDGTLVSDFWQNYGVQVPPDKDLPLDTENPMDMLAILIAKNSPLVASSPTERSATAKFELFSEEELMH